MKLSADPFSDGTPMGVSRRRFLKKIGLALGMMTALTGCGFRLRGAYEFPFQSLWFAPGLPHLLVNHAREHLHALQTLRVLDDPKKAEVHLHTLQYQREKEVLTLTGSGKVREFRLQTRLVVRVLNADQTERFPAFELRQQRTLSWEDREWLGRENEEEWLFERMDEALAEALIRYLAYRPTTTRPSPAGD
jgi:LPS-assembly lipoprotein